MLSFFPRDFLDEIWDLIESVSECFRTYTLININLIMIILFYVQVHIFQNKKTILVLRMRHKVYGVWYHICAHFRNFHIAIF